MRHGSTCLHGPVETPLRKMSHSKYNGCYIEKSAEDKGVEKWLSHFETDCASVKLLAMHLSYGGIRLVNNRVFISEEAVFISQGISRCTQLAMELLLQDTRTRSY